MLFNKTDIRDACGGGAYQRGADYQQSGRVLTVSGDPGRTLIEARVRGSGGQVYEQTIEFEALDAGTLIDGDCSCPVGYNCKHVAAVLLELLDGERLQPEPPAASPLARWRAQLDTITTPAAAAPELDFDGRGPRERLLYLLQVWDDGGRSRAMLRLARVRLLAAGGYGKPQPYYPPETFASYHHYGGYYPGGSRYLDDADRDIIRRLQLTASGRGDRFELGGEDGALLLRRLVASGRCHLGNKDAPPLAPGPERAVEFSWHGDRSEPEPLTALCVRVEGLPTGWLCCPTDPPWYIDPEQLLAGPLQTSLSGALLDLLLHLPPVAEAELAGLARQLYRQLPADSLPLPVELAIVEIDQPPVPVLRLAGEADGGRPRAGYFARLTLCYADIELTPLRSADDPDVWLSDENTGTEYRVRQHPQAEAEALAQLLQLGFEPVPTWAAAGRATAGRDDEILFVLPAATPGQTAQRWLEFLERDRPALEERGWRVEFDPSFELQVVRADRWRARVSETPGENWFELALNVEIGGRRLALLPLLTQLLEQDTVVPQRLLEDRDSVLLAVEAGLWLELPAAQLRPVLAVLVELFDGGGGGGVLRLLRQQAAALIELEQSLAAAPQPVKLSWRGGKKLRRLGEKLRDFSGITPVEPPATLRAELRPYQRQGLSWLQFLTEYGFGGILADDMGLGKTVQALAHILSEKRARRLRRPVLVVAPTSLLGNWRREAQRFAPSLKVLTLHGPQRKPLFRDIDRHDLILTTYPLLSRDQELLAKRHFHCVLLDEAQVIKNPRSKTAHAAARLQAPQRLCLTGTPLENHLGELWSLMHFAMPGFLSDENTFNRLFRRPVEVGGDSARQRELARRVRPFMLRRTKQAVAAELPPKSEILQTVTLEGDQALLYESIRVAMEARVRQLLRSRGLARSHIDVLDALLKLRQTCCDPRLVPLDAARKVQRSAKLELLLTVLPELLADGRRVLLFSQFTTMLGLIETELQGAAIRYSKLTGRTRKRDQAIAAFQDGEVPVFLVSLKAGGVGLNLTAADTVIIYDPWWNPAVEQQAIDRAYRIGQDKPVFVYKLIAESTVEEKILQMQTRKQALADGIFDPGAGAAAKLTAEEILALFRPLR